MAELADATSDTAWRDQARTLAVEMVKQFGDTQNGGFYSTGAASQADLLARLKEGEDNATPSANGIAARVLVRLGGLTGEAVWKQQAIRTIQAFQPVAMRAPSAFPTLLTAYQELGPAAPPAAAGEVVEVTAEPMSAKAGANAVVTLRATIQPGWHINANKVSARYLIPAELALLPGSKATLARVEYPAARMAKFAFAPGRLAVYEGTVTINVTVRPLARGPLDLKFRLRYQACNDRACLAPASRQVSVRLDVR